MKVAKLKINILKEVNQFHWKASDNFEIKPSVIGIIF